MLKTSERDLASILNFIQSGINVNVQDENGMTALMLASQAGHVELIQEFLKAGSSVNIQNLLGNTALILATSKNKTNVCGNY